MQKQLFVLVPRLQVRVRLALTGIGLAAVPQGAVRSLRRRHQCDAQPDDDGLQRGFDVVF